MKRSLFIFGTRPEAIKMAPIILAFREHPRLEPLVCLTGQHREMLHQILPLFDITPDIDLDLMHKNQSLDTLTAEAIRQLGPVITQTRPDWVLVQGDTTTTFCGALAAFYHFTPVAHVEAGLRTGDMHTPFPEEMNRVLTSRLANLHFAPTETNRQALLKEGVADNIIHVTGNTVIDALLWANRHLEAHPEIELTNPILKRLDRPYVLITGHRRESFGEGFQQICQAIKRLALAHPECDFLYPVHLNPHVRQPVQQILSRIDNVILEAPQGYLEFILLMKHARFILTDSGGVQEEAPSLGKPVLVMREKTERAEGLAKGVELVGNQEEMITQAAEQLFNQPEDHQMVFNHQNPYGDGQAARRIAEIFAK